MFDQKQYVEFYLQDDLFNKMALTQHKLIELALLLGSDYTEGIKGIGPVQAMEILAEFGNLEKFKEWFDKHTKSVADKTELTKLQKSLLDRIKRVNFIFLIVSLIKWLNKRICHQKLILIKQNFNGGTRFGSN